MATLSYGLNVTKKPTSLANRPTPAKRKTIFDDNDDGPDDGGPENAEEAIDTIGGIQSASISNSPKPSKRPKIDQPPTKPTKTISQYGDLSTNHSTRQHASTAQSLDPSIYDYDSVYDSLHAAPSKKSKVQGPRYMSNLLEAAEIRKRDQLRAKEKMLQRERELEGEEFADKEKFVTGAYKAQQEMIKKMEEEELRKEKADSERKRREGGGMTGLYKGLLERDERRHEEVLKAVEERKGKGEAQQDLEESEAKSEAEVAKGKQVLVNDDGVIVDKRDLLGAGLNIVAKPKAAASTQKGGSGQGIGRGAAAGGMGGKMDAKQAMRERQTRMLEAQLEEAANRAVSEEDAKREAVEKAAKSRKTEGDIMSARERYLQRKKEAAEASKTN
jgi:coiled-coil domain-containing protein 55